MCVLYFHVEDIKLISPPFKHKFIIVTYVYFYYNKNGSAHVLAQATLSHA